MIRYILVVFSVLVSASNNAFAQYTTLYTWHSELRKDHFTTSDSRWAGEIGDRRSPDYRLIRIEGAVLSPENPQPADTIPLYSFWNEARGDNFLSSDENWTQHEEQDGYRRFRLEGYVYSNPKAGTVPLVNLWSTQNKDNFASTDPRLALEPNVPVGRRTAEVTGGDYRTYRIEGYMLPPPSARDALQPAHSANLTDIGFGAWRPLHPNENGVRPRDPIARATANFQSKVLIVPLEFSDLGVGPGDLLRYGNLASATSDLSLERAVKAVSRGKFSWEATLTPVIRDRISVSQAEKMSDAWKAYHNESSRLADGTIVNWSPAEFERRHGFPLSVYDLDGDGVGRDEVSARTRLLKLIDPFVRYNIYDENNDGRVDQSELAILRMGPGAGIGGQMLSSGDYSADDKTVAVPVGILGKDSTRAGLAHELFHIWGGTDVYGPRIALNFRNTIMAGMAGDDLMWELDPWHLQKFGWIRPRFMPIGSVSRPAGGSETILAAGHDIDGQEAARPIVFYDPRAGLREYFIAQYRTPFPRCPGSNLPNDGCADYQDSGAPDIGFAIWHVVTTQAGDLWTIQKGNDAGDRVAWPQGTNDDGNFSFLGTVDPADGKVGRTNYLRPEDGELVLRWLNGTDTGLRLKAGFVSETSPLAVLQWRDGAQAFSPRLDAMRVAGFPAETHPKVNPGQPVAFDGVFGVEKDGFGGRIIAEDGSVQIAEISSWGPTRIVAEIPNNTRPGRYKLVVGYNAMPVGEDGWSNGLKFEIPAQPIPRIDVPVEGDRQQLRVRLDAFPRGAQLDLRDRVPPSIAPPPGSALPPHKHERSTEMQILIPKQPIELHVHSPTHPQQNVPQSVHEQKSDQ